MDYRKEIEKKLLPLFRSKKCAILDVPTYSNVGDQLIWDGMEQFLQNNGIECVYRSSCETMVNKKLPEDVTICLMGGGNFGDMWRGLQELKNQVVQNYPNHRIVIFPQSVCYTDMSLCKKDSELFARHKDVYICARDEEAYEFLKKHFRNTVLLVPDMVLYLTFDSSYKGDANRVLFIKREDSESIDYTGMIQPNMEIHDWPTHKELDATYVASVVRKRRWEHRLLRYGLKVVKSERNVEWLYRLCAMQLLRRLGDERVSLAERWEEVFVEINYLLDLNMKISGRLNGVIMMLLLTYHLPLIKAYAVEFMQPYGEVYSTRLHGGILAFLLGKQVKLIDNSYGKVSAIYKTWLVNEPNIELVQ